MSDNMTNDEFRRIWNILDDRIQQRSEGSVPGLTSLSLSGILDVAEGMKADLDKFGIELVARAKAKFEAAQHDEEILRNRIGADKFDAIQPEYTYGLDFGPRK